MQKLEEVLHAEEAARHTVNAARDRAAAILADADIEAKHIADAARSEAAATAKSLNERAQAHAAEQVAAIESAAAVELESTMRTARSRMSQAVQVALDELLS